METIQALAGLLHAVGETGMSETRDGAKVPHKLHQHTDQCWSTAINENGDKEEYLSCRLVAGMPEVTAQGTDGLLEVIESYYHNDTCSSLLVSGQACDCWKARVKAALPSHDAALIQKRDREWALVCAEHDIAALADSNGPIKLNPDALKASVREEAAAAAMEAFGHNETNLPHSDGCIACTVKAALAHTDKATQPHKPGCSALAALDPEERICDCRVAQQTEGKQP